MDASQQKEMLDSIEGALEFDKVANNLMATLEISLKAFNEQTGAPDKTCRSQRVRHFINGAMIVYLFNIWDTYFTTESIQKYFRDDEKKIFYAFKHIRIVAAHNTDGSRIGNKSHRMNHADKLDDIMASSEPLEGIVIEELQLDMSNSYTALDCRDFLANMAKKLAAGRISVGGAHGEVRVSGGGTCDVM